jgi:hypothetical protein
VIEIHRCEKEFRFPMGMATYGKHYGKADLALLHSGEIYDVKPDHPDPIRKGRKQVADYVTVLEGQRKNCNPNAQTGLLALACHGDPSLYDMLQEIIFDGETNEIRRDPPGPAWHAGKGFEPFHMDYKGHRILVRYAGGGVAAYRPDCDPQECDSDHDFRKIDQPTTWHTLTTPFRWLNNIFLPGIRPVPAPVP